MINGGYLFLLILFIINILLYGTGYLTQTNFNQSFGVDVLEQTPQELYDNTNDASVTGVSVDSNNSSSITNSTPIQFLKTIKNMYSYFNTIVGYVFMFVFGYAIIFKMMGLPVLLVFLFTGMIGILQLIVIFNLALQIISAIKGMLV